MKLVPTVLCCLILFVWACSVDNSNIPTLVIGEEFSDSNVRIIAIDTFTVAMSTFKFDSINTSSTDRLLFGSYRDPEFGQVKASPYFELSALQYEIEDEAELDSVALILGYDTYSYNDTTALSGMRVHLLQERVDPGSDEFYYNTSSLSYDLAPLTRRSFLPEPFDEDSLYVNLPYSFGLDLFTKIQDGVINNDFDLFENFNGFTLQPDDTTDGAIVGFTLNPTRTYLRLFYSTPDEVSTDEGTFDFFIDRSVVNNNAFNQIINDPIGTPLALISDQEDNLSSEDSGNQAFFQSGVGYVTRIQFPTIKTLRDIAGVGTLLSARLKVKPAETTNTDLLPISDSLDVAVVDQNNIITQALETVNGQVFGTLNDEESEFDNLIYEIPVGLYLDQKLAEQNEIDDAIIIFPRSFNKILNRGVLQDDQSSDFKAVLEVIYAIYDEDDGL